MCRAFAKLHWHPFTISSSRSLESDNISVIIKGEGKWTTKLIDFVDSPTPPDRLDVSIEGIYGPASTDFLRHELLVMVSGGSGVMQVNDQRCWEQKLFYSRNIDYCYQL